MGNSLKASFSIDNIAYTPTYGDFTQWANGGARIHYFDAFTGGHWIGKFMISTNVISRAVVHEAMLAYLHVKLVKERETPHTLEYWANSQRPAHIGRGTSYDPDYAYFNDAEEHAYA